MKKKALSLLLTLALCLSLLPTAAWATEDTQDPAEQAEETGIAVQADEHTNHPVCGSIADNCTNAYHDSKHTAVTDWKPISDEAGLRAATSGYYYLTTDVEISTTWKLTVSGVVLCLNGNTLKAKGDFDVIEIDEATFTLTDCKTTGEVTHDTGKTGRGVYNRYGTFEMYGGNITANNAGSNDTKGGGVYNYTSWDAFSQRASWAYFDMYGGSITKNTATDGGGVYDWAGLFYMYGGNIANNTATGSGGGVYTVPTGLADPDFYMSGNAAIKYNKASTGSGVYTADAGTGSGVDFRMSDNAEISGNTATSLGGVYLNNGSLRVSGSAKINENKTEAGANSNVYLPNKDRTVTIGNDFTGTVGVTTGITVTESVPVSVASGANSGDEDHFKSDNDNYEIKLSGSDLVLAVKPQSSGHTHYLCGGDTCTGVGSHTDTETDFTAWNETDKLPTIAGKYYLENNVTVSSAWEPANGTVLCLNGHTITAADSFNDTGVIEVKNNANFALTDCEGSGNKGAVVISVKKDKRGVAVNGGNFTLYNGTISVPGDQCIGEIVSWGSFTMNGGTISSSNLDGVYVGISAGFTMNSGTISNNQRYGVNVIGSTGARGQGSVTMTGGTITGNGQGGVAVTRGNTLTVSGSPNITGNNGKNVDLSDGKIIVADNLGDAAKIGVTVQNAADGTLVAEPDTGVTLTAADAAKFASDNTNYSVVLSDNGNLVLGKKDSDHDHIWNEFALDEQDHSRIIMYCSASNCTATGGSVTVKALTNRTYFGTPPRATVETSADWLGVAADNITIWYQKKIADGRWTTLSTTPYTGTGTHYAYIRMYSAGGITVEANVQYDLTEITKNDVSKEIKFDNGELTYTGSGLTYEKATISEGYTGSFTYTYAIPKGGSTGELDANGLPVDVGIYTVIATYEDDDNYGTAHATLTVVAGSNNSGSSGWWRRWADQLPCEHSQQERQRHRDHHSQERHQRQHRDHHRQA